jgi:hypothetical protein
MIYTTYFAKLNKLPPEIIPISICGKAPGFYTGLQCKKFAPKYDFFMKWKETHDNDYYISCFNEQVLKNLSIKDIWELYRMAYPNLPIEPNIQFMTDNHIALVCYEKPTDFCHRHLVSAWIRNFGIPSEEIKI